MTYQTSDPNETPQPVPAEGTVAPADSGADNAVEDSTETSQDTPDSPFDGETDEVTPDNQTKSVEEVAREVVEGKWGVGQERRVALDDAGYDANEVQEEVTKLLNQNQ